MKMLFFDFNESDLKFFSKFNSPDFDIEFIKNPLSIAAEFTDEQLKETDIICVNKNSIANQDTLEKFKNLRIISTRSTEYKHIDLNYCRLKHIAVFNVNDVSEADKILEITFNNIRDYCKGLHTNQIY